MDKSVMNNFTNESLAIQIANAAKTITGSFYTQKPYLFNAIAYLNANNDVAAAGLDPWQHYITFGWREGRDPTTWFDGSFYLAQNANIAATGIDPFTYYLSENSAKVGKIAAAVGPNVDDIGFDRQFYLMSYADVAASGVDPRVHWDTWGWREGRNPNAYFNTNGYLTRNLDVSVAQIDPLMHYHVFGWREGRDPSTTLDTALYLATNSDVAAAGIDPLLHLLRFGLAEGRLPLTDNVWGNAAKVEPPVVEPLPVPPSVDLPKNPAEVAGFQYGPALPALGVGGDAVLSSTASRTIASSLITDGQRDGTAGNDYFYGAGVKVAGGQGDDYYGLSPNQAYNVIEKPGEGIDTIVMWSNGVVQLPDNVENIEINVATDNPLYGAHVKAMGDAGGPSALGNSMANYMSGSNARNLLDGMSGNDMLIGRGNADTFVFGLGYDHDTVVDFVPNIDRVRLVSGGLDWNTVHGMLSNVMGNAVLTLSDGSTLTLNGVSSTQLRASDFEFAPDPSKYRLTFEDNFNTLDLADGRHGDGGVWRQGTSYAMGPIDRQAFISNNYEGLGIMPFSVDEGTLAIKSEYHPELASQLDGREYTSGMLQTRDSFAQLYGVFEVRMKTDLHEGGWPAFWLLATDGTWPPEIDVMEQLSSEAHGDTTLMHQTGFDTIVNSPSGWHTYTIEWTAERIVWLVDGKMTNIAYDHGQNKAMYILLNYALGGWGGDIANPGTVGASAGGIEVDYVRAWELIDGASPHVTTPTGASTAMFSLGTASEASIGNTFSYLASTSGKSHLYDRQFDFESYHLQDGIYAEVDRANNNIIYKVENINDAIAGGRGLNASIYDGDGSDITLTGFARVQVVMGGSTNVSLTLLDNQHGDIVTGAGDDTINATRVRDIISGQGSVWSVSTGAGNDTVLGWSGQTNGGMNINLGDGNDYFRGTAGIDVIRGGAGNDTLRGGAGADKFVYSKTDLGNDSIEDFAVWQDKLVLEGYSRGDISFRATDGGVDLMLSQGQHVLLEHLSISNISNLASFIVFT